MKISPTFRLNFRELCVGLYLGQINDMFEAAGFRPDPERARPCNGERRSRVEAFYAGIDWGDLDDNRKFLDVLTLFLAQTRIDAETKTELKSLVAKEGLVVHGTQVRFATAIGPAWVLSAGGVDRADFTRYCERIEESIDPDPEQAIGASKELAEAVLKHILERQGEGYDRSDSLSKLMKKVCTVLELSIADVADEVKGSKAIRQVLGSLGSVVQGMAELRNLYGTGHGRPRRSTGVKPRHARLAVGAAVTVCTFLLDTLDTREDS